ncbi:MAG: hypothetical protein FJ086_05975 [Deltaproteobacteria bacterium]|nr:hypothetical protein [Deltaproteobacteria bacterium]
MRALTLVSLLLLPLIASAAVPRRMTWYGRLARADGSPETNPQSLKFALYAAASGGSALWEETLPSVQVVNGAYAVVLGQASPLPGSVVNGQDLYLGLSLNGGAELQPRVRVASVPYALTAGDAHALEGRTAADFALTSHSHPNASSTAAGFMSAPDKVKLDGLNSSAFAPSNHGHSDATTTSPGFMSSSDKVKLDKYPSTPADEPALSCTYRKNVVTGGDFTATAQCAATEMLVGSTCATLNSEGVLLSGSQPVGVTAGSSSTGKGVRCLGTGSNGTEEVHAWVFCCKL